MARINTIIMRVRRLERRNNLTRPPVPLLASSLLFHCQSVSAKGTSNFVYVFLFPGRRIVWLTQCLQETQRKVRDLRDRLQEMETEKRELEARRERLELPAIDRETLSKLVDTFEEVLAEGTDPQK